MIKGNWRSIFKVTSIKYLLLCLTSLAFFSCQDITQEPQSSTSRSDSTAYQGTGKALIYEVNPIVRTGNINLVYPNMKKYVSARFLTNNNFLQMPCAFTHKGTTLVEATTQTLGDCLTVLNDSKSTTELIQAKNGGWDYSVDSDAFYQINTFFHIKKMMERFYESLSYAHEEVHINSPMSIPPATKYNFSATKSYALTKLGLNTTLRAYSKCELENLNAYFDPASNELCLGYNSAKDHLRMAQDPSIIYHELGHVLVKIMMNQRNITSGFDPNTFAPHFSSHPFESQLGSVFYDEAGGINEGIADFFSYYINKRTKIGEWGLSKAVTGSATTLVRPLTETDSTHSAHVSEKQGERLAYPNYLHYDASDSSKNFEDVHITGQIVSHYLFALTEDFKNKCTISSSSSDDKHKEATNMTVLLLSETLAEIGDLTAKGSDLFSEFATLDLTQENVFYTNLNDTESYLWTQVVNPANFRRFFRIFGKNIRHYISGHLCPTFTLDDSEKLLDEYGLLLFKSYEDRGNGINASTFLAMNYNNYNGKQLFSGKNLAPFVLNSEVNENNRRNSVLIAKEFIELDEESQIYLFDGQSEIRSTLSSLTFAGKNVTTTQGIAGVEYNNSNVKISPGEVVAIAPNLFNKSNSTMAGVQVLANDWDHMKINLPADPIYSDGNAANDPPYTYTNRDINSSGLNTGAITGYRATFSPCIFDDFPSLTEGGVTDTATTTAGNCSHISKTNYALDKTEVIASTTYPKHELDSPQPICMVQYSDTNETKWVAQDFFRYSKLGLEDKDCLNNPSMSGDDFNPNECLIRFLPGASQAIFGKISAQKTWVDTLKENTDQDVVFKGASNTLVMEVNKWIQPGTKFNCRMRARFTNCSDCFNQSNIGDDYSDYEYGGAHPYKTINFQFTVLD